MPRMRITDGEVDSSDYFRDPIVVCSVEISQLEVETDVFDPRRCSRPDV